MKADFFSKNVQDSIKAIWSRSTFDSDVDVNFSTYYTEINSDPYKSRRYRVGNFHLSSHLAWWMPQETDELKVEVSLDPLTNRCVVEGTETGFTLKQPVGTELAHLSLTSGEKGVFVLKNWFQFDSSKHLELTYAKGKGYSEERRHNSFTLAPARGQVLSGDRDLLGRRGDYGFFKSTDSIGWAALDAEIIDDHTLRVYMTDALYRENVDFHNLVLQLKFSESLEACRVGYNGIPNYFGEIASRGVDGETVLRERFGDLVESD